MVEFTFDEERIELPRGAWAGTRRRWLRADRRPVLAMTNGTMRPYVYPLLGPSGHLLTSESPADHPHHQSVWFGADHVHIDVPAMAGGSETYAYNFYVNETFQGRAAGRIVEREIRAAPQGANHFEIVQQLDWRGPAEWAAPHGRVVAREQRTWRVAALERAYRITVSSELSATEWAITLGPTRHAYFNVRVAETMTGAHGGVVTIDRGGEPPRWVDLSGPVGGGALAGVTVIAEPIEGLAHSWFTTDWGVATVGPFRERAIRVEVGRRFTSRYALLVHDGCFDPASLDHGSG